MTDGTPYWLRDAPQPAAPALRRVVEADVVVIGAGFTGLWTALELSSRRPSARIVICEAGTVASGASGQNGGFYEPSLTHGLANGVRHFPREIETLEQLARTNDIAFRGFLDDHNIDCDFEATGQLDVATAPWQLAELAEAAKLHASFGQDVELLDAAGVRRYLDSPTYHGALHRPHAGGILDPVKLARGLARVAVERGVTIYETTPVRRLRRCRDGVWAEVSNGAVQARAAVVATNVWTDRLLRRTRRHYVPVYDYVLATEPLGGRLSEIGWAHRQGVSDSGNAFHYYRLTADDRILWGGYDAVYHYGNAVGPRYAVDPSVFALLESHFRATFPQLRDIRFEHRWGGAIDTSTRFTPAFGTALGGRAAYAVGFTGLGVAATRFAATVLADRLMEPASPLLRLRAVRHAPFPFPPEPLRSVAVNAVRWSLTRADADGGRRNLLLRGLDAAGIGFDS